MKKYSIFAAFKSGTFSSISKVAAFFIALNLAVNAANIGYQIPADCCTLQSVIVPDRTGGDSLSYFDTSFFRLHMSGTTKIASEANNSNLTSTPSGAKSVPLTAYNRLKSHSDTLERFIDSHGLKQLFAHFNANPSKRNLWLYSLNKAYNEFLTDSQKGLTYAEIRLMDKIKAAKVLFPEDKQSAITTYDKREINNQQIPQS